jgi:hypothetical protein
VRLFTLVAKISVTEITRTPEQRWNVDGSGEWLVIHKNDRIIKPEDCPQFLLDCTTLLNAMTLT